MKNSQTAEPGRFPHSVTRLPKRGNVYAVRFRDPDTGSQKQKVLHGTENLHSKRDVVKLSEIAWEAIEKYFRDVRKATPVGGGRSVKALSLETSIEDWLGLDKGLCQPGTLRSIRFNLKRFFKPVDIQYVHEISQEISDSCVTAFLKAVREKETAAHYWGTVRSYTKDYFGYLLRKKLIPVNFLADVEAPAKDTFKVMDVMWTREEFEAIAAELDQPWKMEFTLQRFTGMDQADLATLKKSHIKQDETGKWCITKPRQKELRFKAAQILLPLFGDAEKIIMKKFHEIEDDDGLIFPHIPALIEGGHSVLYNRVRRRWGRLFPKKPCKNLKALRHTFTTWAIEDLGIPLDVVQDWLGHSPKSVVLRDKYLHRRSTAKYGKLVEKAMRRPKGGANSL